MADVQKRIPYFIEDVYKQKRLHSSGDIDLLVILQL